MKVKVYPCKLSGTAVVPASKSYAHRALICAALADGESKVECADMNDDIRATIRAVTALGAKVKYSEGILTVNGITGRVKEDIVIDCGESGSTLRFIIPVALTLCDGYVRFVGGGKLGDIGRMAFYRKKDVKIYGDRRVFHSCRMLRNSRFIQLSGDDGTF